MSSSGPYQSFKIATKTRENYRSSILELDGFMDAEPGQFVMVWLPGIGEKPYSIMQSCPMTLLVVEVGKFSEKLGERKVGETIWVRGPLGMGFKPGLKKPLLVGGGYGAAPILFLANSCHERNLFPEVFLGAKTKDDLALVDRFLKMDLPVQVSTEDGSVGEKGLITSLLQKRIESFKDVELFACGPGGMLDAVESIAHSHNINCQLSREAHMRCGIGLCGSCELEKQGKKTGWLTCLDGPVEMINQKS